MLENGKIHNRQFMILVLLFTIGNTIINAPSLLAKIAKQDAWISSILAIGIGILLIILYDKLIKRYPTKNLYAIIEDVFGTTLGKIISFLYVSYFFILSTLMLRQVGDFMTIKILADTPMTIILIMFIVPVLLGAFFGLETFSRTSELLAPWVFLLTFLGILLTLPLLDVTKITPVLENGFRPILKGTYFLIGIPILQLIVFLVFHPYVNRSHSSKKFFLVGYLIGGVILTIVISFSLLILGAEQTAHHMFPTYTMAKKISIGNFFERMEAILAVVWFITIFIKTTILYYATVIGIASIFKLKEYQFLVLPLALIQIFLVDIISPNTAYYRKFFSEIFTSYALTYALIIPVILVTISKFKKNNH